MGRSGVCGGACCCCELLWMEVDLKVRMVGRREGVLGEIWESREVGNFDRSRVVLGIIMRDFEACRGENAALNTPFNLSSTPSVVLFDR